MKVILSKSLAVKIPVIAALSAAVLAAALFMSCGSPADPPYVILAANDLGMHCIQSDYSKFMILPPGNNPNVGISAAGALRKAGACLWGTPHNARELFLTAEAECAHWPLTGHRGYIPQGVF